MYKECVLWDVLISKNNLTYHHYNHVYGREIMKIIGGSLWGYLSYTIRNILESTKWWNHVLCKEHVSRNTL